MLEITPLMQQYNKIKQNYQDAILMFRIGDFYEMFNEDAKIASSILNIVLTSKPIQKNKRIPLAGIPYHAANTYISSLLKTGYKVAICEQVENPKQAKGVVKREVVRVITPGTNLDNLEEKNNNFLAAINTDGIAFGLSIVDLSTGEFLVSEFFRFQEIIDEFLRIQPIECLLPKKLIEEKKIFLKKEFPQIIITSLENHKFEFDTAYFCLIEHFRVHSLEGFGCEHLKVALGAAGAIIYFLKETQKQSLNHITKLKPYSLEKFLRINASALNDLEVVKTLREGRKEGSLLFILDETKTSMAGRMLKNWLLKPLIDLEEIIARQEAVEEFVNKKDLCSYLQETLTKIYDIERIMGKIGCKTANPKDLIALKNSLETIPIIKQILLNFSSNLLCLYQEELEDIKEIYTLIKNAIDETSSFSLKEGNLIKKGFNKKIDELKEIISSAKNWIVQFETQEKLRTRINSLKIRYNKIFGYYIEITKANLHLVPKNYIRKQTLVNAERFITSELKDYETKVLNAEEQIIDLECELFYQICDKIIQEAQRIQKVASILANIDCLSNLAYIALKNNYTKPILNKEDRIEIIEGRHPVLEIVFEKDTFVPNDTYLDKKTNSFLIITGPNMAGKSTYIRQVALIVLMAQIGSFVPAKKAVIGIVDKIFTRVGASDNLIKGQSTFMVEMNEVANILNNATSYSLIILDEVGRGTSTFDGISIAWAVSEYIHNTINARTLFATHYYELTELPLVLPKVKNFNILVKEKKEEIIFLRKIIQGITNKSYGIEVARLAGLPIEVLKRAKEVLLNFENMKKDEKGIPFLAKTKEKKENIQQLKLF